MKKDNNPQTRYTPKPSDWNGHNYIPFYDKVNKRAFQYKKDSPEYYEAIKDGLEMMNKEEWYRYREKDRARRNGTTYNPDAPIPKEWQNPKREKTNYEKDLDRRVEDAKRYAAIYGTVGNAASIAGSYIPGPIGTYLMGTGAYMDALQAKENYDDYKFQNEKQGKESSILGYAKTEEGIRDAISLGLDGYMGMKKIPRFDFSKGLIGSKNAAKAYNAVSKVYQTAGNINDVQDSYHNFQYKNGGKIKRHNKFDIDIKL